MLSEAIRELKVIIQIQIGRYKNAGGLDEAKNKVVNTVNGFSGKPREEAKKAIEKRGDGSFM